MNLHSWFYFSIWFSLSLLPVFLFFCSFSFWANASVIKHGCCCNQSSSRVVHGMLTLFTCRNDGKKNTEEWKDSQSSDDTLSMCFFSLCLPKFSNNNHRHLTKAWCHGKRAMLPLLFFGLILNSTNTHTCKCHSFNSNGFHVAGPAHITNESTNTKEMHCTHTHTQTSHKLNLNKSHLALLWLWLLGYEVIMDCALYRLWLCLFFFPLCIICIWIMTVFFFTYFVPFLNAI